jgi:hypothetical protein
MSPRHWDFGLVLFKPGDGVVLFRISSWSEVLAFGAKSNSI